MEKIPVNVDISLIQLFFFHEYVFNKNIGQEKGSY